MVGVHGQPPMTMATDPAALVRIESARAAEPEAGPDAELRLFAAFVGLAIVLVLEHELIRRWLPNLVLSFAIESYQDVAFWFVLVWVFRGLLALAVSARVRRLVIIVGWSACLLTAVFTFSNHLMLRAIGRPLTYQMLLLSQMGTGVEVSILDALANNWKSIVLRPALVIVCAELGSYFVPGWIKRVRSLVYSRAVILLVVLFVVGGQARVVQRSEPAVIWLNPEWTFVQSLFAWQWQAFRDPIPDRYLSGHGTRGHRDDLSVDGSLPRLSAQLLSTAAKRPMNVVMIVMESVGTHWLQLYGAPAPDSPELVRLSEHAIVFDRIYVSVPFTSASMVSLFCAVDPSSLSWDGLIGQHFNLPVPGLAQVLLEHGYHSAFIHSGKLSFDNEGLFLKDHGFRVFGGSDSLKPRDQTVLPEAIQWIKENSSGPFFLAIWTDDSHHPYKSFSHDDYHVSDVDLNRYLNTIHDSDALIGRLVQAFDQMKLSDDTLFVVTGDHGEAFGEHGAFSHGTSLYDVCTHVPLMIANRSLVAHRGSFGGLGRQIDVAPTLLDILGFHEPPEWQGSSLLEAAPSRAYMLAPYDTPSFGLVEGNFAYIFQAGNNRDELYDLQRDPDENANLATNPSRRALISDDRSRLEAWYGFAQHDAIGSGH